MLSQDLVFTLSPVHGERVRLLQETFYGFNFSLGWLWRVQGGVGWWAGQGEIRLHLRATLLLLGSALKKPFQGLPMPIADCALVGQNKSISVFIHFYSVQMTDLGGSTTILCRIHRQICEMNRIALGKTVGFILF